MYIRGGKIPPESGGKIPPDVVHETRFGRVYGEVLHDKVLSLSARAVYAELAYWAISTDRPVRGSRKMADDLGANRETVQLALKELEARGHIKILSSGKQRGRYLMTNPMFRGAFTAEAGGQIVEYYRADGVAHAREVVSRPRVKRSSV